MAKKRPPKTVWHRIIDAQSAGKGLRLTADDVQTLGHDGAVVMRGQLDEAAWERGCAHWWHESIETELKRCPNCGGES